MEHEIRVETLRHPASYTSAQLKCATAIAQALRRGQLVLCEPPQR